MSLSPPALSKFASIPILLRSGSPAAVLRRVVSIVITPLQHHLGMRTWSDIFKKRGKRLAPSFTDLNASSSVAQVIPVPWVLTSTDHSAPSVVFDCARTSMSNRPFTDIFEAKTPTRTSVATSQRCLVNNNFTPALTSTQPSSQKFSRLRFADHDESPVFLPNKVHHGQNCIAGHWRVSLL
jgi:hypothetical protein